MRALKTIVFAVLIVGSMVLLERLHPVPDAGRAENPAQPQGEMEQASRLAAE